MVTPPVLEPPLPGTLLVDVARYQLGINYAKLHEDYVEAGIVKSAGFNDGTLYIAGGVKEHTVGFRTNGMGVGHYYIPGAEKTDVTKDENGKAVDGTSPAQQAVWWSKNATNAVFETDVFMFDNEKLDSNGTVWLDDDMADAVIAFHEETRVPYRRIIVYMGANDWRTKGPWPRLEALRKLGLKFLWAAYGDYPTGTRPDHVPALQGKISDWDYHQYTSTAKLGGWTTGLDAIYSRAEFADLWAPGLVDDTTPEPEPEPDCTAEVAALEARLAALKADIRELIDAN